MNRRDFLTSAGVAWASLAIRGTGRFFAQGAAVGSWRTFEVQTGVEVGKDLVAGRKRAVVGKAERLKSEWPTGVCEEEGPPPTPPDEQNLPNGIPSLKL